MDTKKLYQVLTVMILLMFVFTAVSIVSSPPTVGAALGTDCPIVTASAIVNDRRPSIFFILIDGTTAFFRKGNIKATQKLLNQGLPKVLQPGDHVFAGWLDNEINSKDMNNVIFFDGTVNNIPVPSAFVPPSSPIPLGNPKGYVTPNTQLEHNNNATFVAAANATNTVTWSQYKCNLLETNVQYTASIASWLQQKDDAIHIVTDQVDAG